MHICIFQTGEPLHIDDGNYRPMRAMLLADKLLENGRKELNNEKRKQIYDEFSKIIYDEQPIIYLYAGYGLTAIHKKIKGVKKITPPAGVFHNDYEWYIPKKFRRNEMSF